MELKSFIKQTLIEIINGVDEASDQTNRDINFVHKNSENIQFDIAIAVENSKGKKGGIKVASLLSGDASIESKNSTISRVSFQLYIPIKQN